ncbi:tetratricopeptide repeat protein [Lacinutrix cladophorae]
MSLSENLLKQAENYLENTMSLDEKKAFELHVSNNQELADYVAVNKEMRVQFNENTWSFVDEDSEVVALENYLKSDEANEVKETLKKVNDDFVKEKHSNKKSYFSYFAIAASVLILVGFFMFNNTPTNQEIYAEYNDWSNLPSLTSRGDSDNALLVDGEKAFLNKDYTEAVNYFNTFLETSKYNANALLYFGVSNMEIGSHDKALDAFNQLITSKSLDRSKGYWYKALTYLKMNNKEAAVKTLSILVKDTSNYNYAEALELLNKLKD